MRVLLIILCFAISLSSFANQGYAKAPSKKGRQFIGLNKIFLDPVREQGKLLEIQDLESERTFIIQFNRQINQEVLNFVSLYEGQVFNYIPHNALAVRMKTKKLFQLMQNSIVRGAIEYTSQFKVTPALLAMVEQSYFFESYRYNLVLFSKHDKEAFLEELEDMDSEVYSSVAGTYLVRAFLNKEQFKKLLNNNKISWLERVSPVGTDMDKARIQGGADSIQYGGGQTRFTGVGVRGHVMEGIDPNHSDFAAKKTRKAPIGVGSDTKKTSHGHQTYGIVFGDGAGKAEAKGLLPDAQGYFTNYNAVMNKNGSRYKLVRELIQDYKVMFQTASWGNSRTKEYTAVSLEMDDLIFNLDIPITQSQSNSGTQQSRPQAWAKNIISVGGAKHFNNINPADDVWQGTASVGPASDGRIKPDLVAYYDYIQTTSLEGYTTSFGGTSGATPIVAGYMGITINMWSLGVFGNELQYPEDMIFENRPHFTTTKALLINTASQYPFEGKDHDLTRVHQGWGFPNVKNMYDLKDSMMVINESVILKSNESFTQDIEVLGNEPLKLTLVYADPPGVVAAAIHRVNDLDLKVTSPSGAVYYGNFGLLKGNYSLPNGVADDINTVENIFVESPEAGLWKVEVIASEINQDGHTETPTLDTDFALVVTGIKTP